MNEITIYTQSQPSAVKVYQGKRVITFKDIDTLHQRPEGTAGRNFRANRSRFIEGEDFYTVELTGDEIRRQFGAGKNAGRSMTVLTKMGGDEADDFKDISHSALIKLAKFYGVTTDYLLGLF